MSDLGGSCPSPFGPGEVHRWVTLSPLFPQQPAWSLRYSPGEEQVSSHARRGCHTAGSLDGGTQPARAHRHSSCSILFLNSMSGYKQHSVPLGPDSNG